MTKRQRVVYNEWLFVIETVQGGKGPFTVGVENVRQRDRAFAGAIAEAIAAWHNGVRGPLPGERQVRLK